MRRAGWLLPCLSLWLAGETAATFAAAPAEIDPEHRFGPAYNQQSSPAVCFDGSNFLVTWTDGRAGRYAVAGALVAPHGASVDSTNFLYPMLGESPVMAHDGGHTWLFSHGENRAVRVSSAGQVLDATAIQVLPAAAGSGSHSALAFGPCAGLAACNPGAIWYGDPITPGPALGSPPAGTPAPEAHPAALLRGWHAQGGVSVARVGQDGTILDPLPITVRQDAAASRVAVAFGGDQFLVAWGEASNPDAAARILRVRVSQAGAVFDSLPMELASPSWYLSLGSPRLLPAPTGFWMVYELGFNTYGGRLQAVKLDFDGNLTGTVDLGSVTSRLSGDGAFAAAALGDTVLVTWCTLDNTIDMLRFDSAGMLPGSHVQLFEHAFEHAAGAGAGTFLVAAARSDPMSGNREIIAKRVLLNGTVLDASELVLSLSANAQIDVRLASDGDGALAVWNDYRSFPGTIRLAPLGFDGRQSGSIIDLSVPGGTPRSPALARDDRGALVLWGDRFDPWYGASYLVGRRVEDGGALGPAIRLPGVELLGEEPIQVAWGGHSHLAVWSGGCRTAAGWAGGLWCARLGRDGVPLDSVFVDSLYVPQATQVVSAWASDLLGPALVADTAGWFVAWGQTLNYDEPRRVLAARIDSLSASLDPAGILVGEAAALRGRPDVATCGDQHLVVWAGQTIADNRVDVYAARVSVNGTVLDAQPIRITNDEEGGTHPRVVFDGVFYRVAWLRSSAGGPTECWWATVSPAGFVAEPPALAAAGVVSPPALARTTGTALLVGLSWVHPEWQVPRAATLAVAPAESRLQLQLVSKTANPFRDQARFDLTLASSATVQARVYDVRGRLVRSLYSGSAGTGIHPIVWDGSTTTGRQAPAGVYLVHVVAGRLDVTRKVVLME